MRFFRTKQPFPEVLDDGSQNKILLVGLNSCLMTLSPLDIAKGEVGEKQRARLDEILKDPAHKAIPKIVYLHHIPHRRAHDFGMSLTDYKVRVLEPKKGTAARVRVLIEWSDHRRSWTTVGVSENVIEASWHALVDAIRLELIRLVEKDESIEKAVEDYCWGV